MKTPAEILEDAVRGYIESARTGAVDKNIRFVVAWESEGPEKDTYASGSIRSLHTRPAEGIGLLQMAAAQRLGESS